MSLLGTPTDRATRRRARLLVAFLLVVALGVGVGGTIVSAQEDDADRSQVTLVPTTTEATPSTTEAEATTTTEAEATTTTEAEVTTTTVRRTTTTADDLEDLEGDEVDDESTTTTEETTTTIRDLLVPGDGSAGAASTTTSTTAPPEQASSTTSGISEETMIWLVVAGLVVIAGLIGLWTVRYWRQTRPAPVLNGPEDPTTVFPGE